MLIPTTPGANPAVYKILPGLFTIILLILALSLACGVALADNGPHTADELAEVHECAVCHRVHNSDSDNMLMVGRGEYDFCIGCHDGSGAETDVVNGVLTGNTYGTEGAGLKGGGFVNVKMDTDYDGIITSSSATSFHSTDGATPNIMWGSGPINTSTDYGIEVTLTCGDCHNPHGNGNYRILRSKPYGMENRESAPEINIPDVPGTPVYEITYTDDHYRDLSYVPADLSEWCAQCHTRYLAPDGSGHIDSGDMIYTYRHTITNLTGGCLACHVVHGTSSSMGPYSSKVQYPDPTLGVQGSSLLWLDNRAICVTRCHTENYLSLY